MGTFTIGGTIKNSKGKPAQNLKVFAMDSDQQFFEDHNDDMLGAAWVKANGTFEISFKDDEFQDNILEGQPEIYLIIRNSKGEMIHRTETRKNESKFEIRLESLEKKSEPPGDPYARNLNRVFAAFGSLGDIVTVNSNEFTRNFALLNSTINAWANYTRENIWAEIGYDGPQVPLHPRNTPHEHKLEWENES